MQMRVSTVLVLAVCMTVAMGPARAAELSGRQSLLLVYNCLQCHARAGVGAPQAGDVEAWKKISAKGEAAMLRNAVQGVGGMPPLGYCSACTEEDLRALIRFLGKLSTTGAAR